VLSGCEGVTAPDGATVLRPPSYYAQWYASMEQCSGLRADYRGLTWAVRDSTVHMSDGLNEYGAYDTRQRLIWVVATPQRPLDSVIVTHEMLHDLLWQNGWRPSRPHPTYADLHPSPPFGTCAP
jgi:hypothetical protein